MKQGGNSMKLLKIDNNKGYYIKDADYKEIDSITKEDILSLLKHMYEEDEIEFDEINEEQNQIAMPSQKLVYEKLYEKFVELNEKKDDIISSVEAEFKSAVEKYKASN